MMNGLRCMLIRSLTVAVMLGALGTTDGLAQSAPVSVFANSPGDGRMLPEPVLSASATPVVLELNADDAPPFTLRIGARMQIRYSHFFPDNEDTGGAFGIRRARLTASGDAYQHFRYAMQLELAGGSARLIDANVRVPLAPLVEIWAGQGKTPFGRQQLNSSGNLQLVDRSITSDRFTHGRDVGLMLQGETDRFGYNAGLFNGRGVGVPANPGGRFMSVIRAYMTPFGRYPPSETTFDRPATPRLALGASAMRTPPDSDSERADVSRYGLEAAFKVHGLDVTAEIFRENADILGSTTSAEGWHAQAGFLFPGGSHSVAGRYARIGLAEDAGLDEAGVGYSYHLRQHRAKVQADLRDIRDRLSLASRQEIRAQLQLTM
jgi:phosphate-selective porin OprO and OprP